MSRPIPSNPKHVGHWLRESGGEPPAEGQTPSQKLAARAAELLAQTANGGTIDAVELRNFLDAVSRLGADDPAAGADAE